MINNIHNTGLLLKKDQIELKIEYWFDRKHYSMENIPGIVSIDRGPQVKDHF